MGKRTKWLSSTNLKIVGYADNFIVITSTISHHHVSSGGHRRREEAGWWIRKGVGRYRSTNSRVIDWAYVWWWAPNEGRARRNAQWSMLLVEFESLYIPLIYIDCRRRPSVSKSSTAALSCTTGSFDSAWKFIAVWNLELALCYVPPIIIIVRHLCVHAESPESGVQKICLMISDMTYRYKMECRRPAAMMQFLDFLGYPDVKFQIRRTTHSIRMPMLRRQRRDGVKIRTRKWRSRMLSVVVLPFSCTDNISYFKLQWRSLPSTQHLATIFYFYPQSSGLK